MTQAANNNGINVNRNPANNPERNMNESYEEYVIRRAEMNKRAKRLKYGVEFHDSGYAGTFENPAKRKLQEERKQRREAKRG